MDQAGEDSSYFVFLIFSVEFVIHPSIENKKEKEVSSLARIQTKHKEIPHVK